MYEYGPPDGKKNPLKGDDETKHVFVPLKEQLKGLVKDDIELSSPTSNPPSPDVKPEPAVTPAKKGRRDRSDYRTGVLEQTMSPNLALTISGLLIAFMTVVTLYTTAEQRVNILIGLGTVFLITALVSLFGSHIMSQKGKELNFFRAFNGVTVGLGAGFVFSTAIFFIAIATI